MAFEIINLIISILTFLALVLYAYFTYLIARDVYEPFVSFMLKPSIFALDSSIFFIMANKSKVEVEVFSKIWTKINNKIFYFKDGFYGDKSPWILQPFSEGNGHFDLKEMVNKEGTKFEDLLKNNKTSSFIFNLQVKYRKVGSRRWKKSYPQKFFCDFKDNLFWLNV